MIKNAVLTVVTCIICLSTLVYALTIAEKDSNESWVALFLCVAVAAFYLFRRGVRMNIKASGSRRGNGIRH